MYETEYYCANYYSSVNCTQPVSVFGERCKLCTIMRTGTDLSVSLAPRQTAEDMLYSLQSESGRKNASSAKNNATFLSGFWGTGRSEKEKAK